MNPSAHQKILAGGALVLAAVALPAMGNAVAVAGAVEAAAVEFKASDRNVQDKSNLELMLFMHRADLPVFPQPVEQGR